MGDGLLLLYQHYYVSFPFQQGQPSEMPWQKHVDVHLFFPAGIHLQLGVWHWRKMTIASTGLAQAGMLVGGLGLGMPCGDFGTCEFFGRTSVLKLSIDHP